MRRRFLILWALIVLGTTSVCAADFVWGGGFSSVWAIAPDSDYVYVGAQYGYITSVAKIDDNNSVTMVYIFADDGAYLGVDPEIFSSDYADFKIDKAVLTTDIFGALGLEIPVALSMSNGFGRLNIHDRYEGVGTGWDPEIFANGALDGSTARYMFTGFDWSVLDIIYMRLYGAPATFNKEDLSLLTEYWIPFVVNDFKFDLGGWLVLEDGYILGVAEETIPVEPDGNIWAGFRFKGSKSFDIVDLGFWLGSVMHSTTRYDYEKDDGSQKFDETVKWTFVEAISLGININESLNFQLGFWAKEKLNMRFGDDYDDFYNSSQSEIDIDPDISFAVDFKINYAQFFFYGGVITTDIAVDMEGAERMNGRWDLGVGYLFGVSSVKFGASGPFIDKYIGTRAASLPTNDGLGVCQPVLNNPASSGDILYPVIYFTTIVLF